MMKDPVFDWHKACRLLESRQYEQVAEFLQEAQRTSRQTDSKILVDILTAAHTISLACSQCRDEAALLSQAGEAAERRESELKHELQDILTLVTNDKVSETGRKPAALPVITSLNLPDPNPSKFSNPNSLWRRIQRMLGFSKTSLVPEREILTRANSALADKTSTEGKVPIDLTLENSKKVSVAPPIEQKKQYDLSPSSLVVYCLGPFRVYNNDRSVKKWPGQKCKSLFKYIIINREQPIHQEILMDLFWADTAPQTARRNLYQAIYSLRQALQTDGADAHDVHYVLCEDNCYLLNPELDLWVDSESFIGQYQAGQNLERQGQQADAVAAYEAAESLYADDFLMEDLYEDWLLVHRENLKHAYLDILEQLSQYYFEQHQWATCITFCQKILGKDNCREDAHRRLMRCYMHQGQRHLALRQYHLCVEALERELDVPPMPATVNLCQKIRQITKFNFPPHQN